MTADSPIQKIWLEMKQAEKMKKLMRKKMTKSKMKKILGHVSTVSTIIGFHYHHISRHISSE